MDYRICKYISPISMIIVISLFCICPVHAAYPVNAVSLPAQPGSISLSDSLYGNPGLLPVHPVRYVVTKSLKSPYNDISIVSSQELQSIEDRGGISNPDQVPEVPEIVWAESFGGSGDEYAECIKPTRDGGYIVAGYTSSHDGTGNSLVIKLDSLGKLVWQKLFGKGDYNRAYDIVQTSDGGYIVAGSIESPHFSGNISRKSSNYWAAKLDPSGELVWEKSLGGSENDTAYALTQTSDGGFVIAGSSYCDNRDVSGNRGGSDYWVIKFDLAGNVQWKNSYGGSEDDIARSIIQTRDGCYIIAGSTWSDNCGDVSGFHHSPEGNPDFWILKLDEKGKKIWQRSLGSSGWEEAMSIREITGGGYVIAGLTSAGEGSSSIDGDITGRIGNKDFWIVKVAESGRIVWQKCLGGSLDDAASDIEQTPDGGYITAGWTMSADGNVTGLHGGEDFWIVRLNEEGKILWQTCLGGKDTERSYSLALSDRKEAVVAGTARENDGDVRGNHGEKDFWVVKLTYEGQSEASPPARETRYGSLRATSTPPGAEIRIDGSDTGNVTPSIITNIPAGPHSVVFSKPGFADYSKNVTIQIRKTTTESAVLISDVGSIGIGSTPAGAQIFIDSLITGYETPYTFSAVPAGLHSVALVKENYKEWVQNVTIIARKTTGITATLIPKEENGSVMLQSTVQSESDRGGAMDS